MASLQIPETIRKWTKDFMTNRTVIPRRNGKTGTTLSIDEGLPQGSPTSPVLFAILIADIGRSLHPHIKIFADDIQLVQQELSTGLPVALDKLRDKAIKVSNDLHNKGLRIDHDKTQLLVSPLPETPATITIGTVQISSQEHIHYLGTTFQPLRRGKSPFDKNVKLRASKAVAAAGMGMQLMS